MLEELIGTLLRGPSRKRGRSASARAQCAPRVLDGFGTRSNTSPSEGSGSPMQPGGTGWPSGEDPQTAAGGLGVAAPWKEGESRRNLQGLPRRGSGHVARRSERASSLEVPQRTRRFLLRGPGCSTAGPRRQLDDSPRTLPATVRSRPRGQRPPPGAGASGGSSHQAVSPENFFGRWKALLSCPKGS